MIRLVIPGQPCGKERPRVTRRGITYTPKKTKDYENYIQNSWIIMCGNRAPYPRTQNPLRLLVIAYFKIPKSTPKKLRAEMEKETIPYPRRSDWDNIGKIVSDALNGLAYVDDCQIVDGHVQKFYSPNPRVIIELEEAT